MKKSNIIRVSKEEREAGKYLKEVFKGIVYMDPYMYQLILETPASRIHIDDFTFQLEERMNQNQFVLKHIRLLLKAAVNEIETNG